VGRGCCHCPPLAQQTAIAVHRDRAHEVIAAECPPGQPMCHCPASQVDTLAPILHAACVEHKCAAVDLRALEISACTSDSDCVAEGLGCCGATSDQLRDYVAVNKDADDNILQCFPVPSCNPSATVPKIPATSCASDGHCALRKPEKDRGLPSTTCYSPDQNVDHAFDDGATGCDCVTNAAGVCRMDSQGRYIGFICDLGNTWQVVNDGPCGKKP
jgi:hypothetical protein